MRSGTGIAIGALGAVPGCSQDTSLSRLMEARRLSAQLRVQSHAADAVMARMETEMAASEAAARTALTTLASLVDPPSRARLATATAALDRFMAVNAEIVAQSRRNTNVRSLALSLTQERLVTAACDESLRALDDALGKRGFSDTR